MLAQVLATKLYTPTSRPDVVLRQRLINRLNAGLHGKLTLISAPAGFGKTTLVVEWISSHEHPVAWLSLDESDSDPVHFLTYFVVALQKIDSQIGTGILNLLKTPQPPPIDSLLTTLLNELATIAHDFVLVLDDYHTLDSAEIDTALTFLIDNQPPQMHLVLTTREDPRVPLARLRVRGQLTELRATDLRFTPDEAAEFLSQAMGLSLSMEDVNTLEQRTEGWIAGLQLAGISMQGLQDKHEFIRSFAGSHHFVLDYLVEEVLTHQPNHIQDFLLKTSILDRMCGSLCAAVLQDDEHTMQANLENIQNANLFLVPLDNERRWYRYHHLFGELLRKRLGLFSNEQIDNLHIRASSWYEAHEFEVEAFQHAAIAGDTQRAERLINNGVPLYFRGISRPVLNWLDSLSNDVLNSRPSLWIVYAWTLMAAHRSTQIEHKLQSAETALNQAEFDDSTNDLFGQVAAIRAMEAAIQYDTDTIIAQARRALDLLHPDNMYIRTAVTRALAIAYQFRGERATAREFYLEAIAMSEASDNYFVNILATTGLGIIQESDNQLYQAVKSYQRVLDLVGDANQPITCSAHLGLARIYYEFNDLNAAHEYAQHGTRLAQQIEGIDSAASGQIFLARIKLAQEKLVEGLALLDDVEQTVQQRNFVRQMPAVSEARVLFYLRQNNVESASHLAHANDLPLSQARVYLAENNPEEALSILMSYRQQMETKDWHDECLKAMVLQAIAHAQNDDIEQAVAAISEALAFVASNGFVRIFLDEGQPMQRLLLEVAGRGVMPEYVRKLITAFQIEPGQGESPSSQPLIEPLSERELEILALIADGLSNREICERLYLALSTVKGHNRNIFDKLQVKRRTEAIARARQLGLI